MNIEARLQELGIVIPEAAKPVASYLPGVKTDNLIFVSGQLPFQKGELVYSGRVGTDLSIGEGQAAARIATINCLAVVKSLINQWDNLESIVKITGYVQSGSGFYEQAQVLNGASNLLEQILGVKGRHARVAVGVGNLPLNAACMIEMIARIK